MAWAVLEGMLRHLHAEVSSAATYFFNPGGICTGFGAVFAPRLLAPAGTVTVTVASVVSIVVELWIVSVEISSQVIMIYLATGVMVLVTVVVPMLRYEEQKLVAGPPNPFRTDRAPFRALQFTARSSMRPIVTTFPAYASYEAMMSAPT